MATVDPIVEPLLTGLLVSPLAEFGRAASERIDQDEVLGEGGAELGYDRAVSRRRMRAQRQLKLLDTVVKDALRRELQMTARLGDLARKLGVKRIDVLPPEAPEGASRSSRIDSLLKPSRVEAIEAFLETWRDAIFETNQRIDRELDDQA